MANKELSFRNGEKARFWHTIYNTWGNPVGHEEAVVTIVDRPRDESGCFCRASAYGARVKVRVTEEGYDSLHQMPIRVGVEQVVDCDELAVYNTIWDLTHDELKELRGQVVLGSCYTGDYRNKFNIDPNQVYDFCEGYGQEIGWDEDADTPEAFAGYCEGVERYDEAA